VRAHRRLGEEGFGLLVFDGYRPLSVTRLLWDLASPELRPFLADPSRGSRHNRGAAVDASLFELATGAEVVMPSSYDEFTDRAAARFRGGDPGARRRRDLLRAVMEAEGFTVAESEWWHFDHRSWHQFPLLDLPFHEID
jgi:D-alanyl-D-alanine dipeptidase